MSTHTSFVKALCVLFALFSLLFPLANAVALTPGTRRALKQRASTWTPQILYPHAGTVWYRGQTHSVVWNVTGAPANANKRVGEILLRKGGVTTPLILAEDFEAKSGRVTVTVPWVEDGDDYQIVLFKDSGNYSPMFTIDE